MNVLPYLLLSAVLLALIFIIVFGENIFCKKHISHVVEPRPPSLPNSMPVTPSYNPPPRRFIEVIAECLRVGDYKEEEASPQGVFFERAYWQVFSKNTVLGVKLWYSTISKNIMVRGYPVSLYTSEIKLIEEARQFYRDEIKRKKDLEVLEQCVEIEKYIPCLPPSSSKPISIA